MHESQNEILINILNEVKTNRKEFGVAHAAHAELTQLVADDVSILKADRKVFEAKLNRLLEHGKMTAKSLRLLVHRSKNRLICQVAAAILYFILFYFIIIL
jgi:hypothetical protein